jgi:hypothetical protein
MIVEHSAPFSPCFPLALRSLQGGQGPSRPVLCVFVVPVYRLVERFDVYDCRQFCRQFCSFLSASRAASTGLFSQEHVLV